MPTPPVSVFFSYARKDEALRDELAAHLAVLRNQGVIRDWHDGYLGAGEDRKGATAERLDGSSVVLLLVSADFLASAHCFEEMNRALERQRAGQARVIPVILRDCDWQGAAFEGLQALPKSGKPVTSWKDRDRAWKNVALGVRAAVEAVAPERAAPEPSYVDEESRTLGKQLDAAFARKEKLVEGGFSTAKVDREIRALRRQLREGGQLRAGDALGEGRYLLLDQVGRGGFAFVWQAHDRRRDERVAIKVLHANLAGDTIRRERFFRGARLMAELDHEAVVRVLDPHGEDGGYYYFVMELIAGSDMRQAVREGRLSREQVLPVVLRVGEALAHAHSRGLIHRDVKPANILIGTDGAPRLTDFDLVGGAETTGGTRTGALGTFLYAAPELLDRPQDADASADVYGLGMTAVFGLHGADLPQVVVRDAVKFINNLACSPAVKRVLKRAVEWDRDARFPNAGALCEALRSALDAPVEDTLPVEETEAAPKRLRGTEQLNHEQFEEVPESARERLQRPERDSPEQHVDVAHARQVKSALVSAAKDDVLLIDASPILGSGGGLRRFKYSEYRTVSELLDDVYGSFSLEVPAFTYGETWLLREPKSGRALGVVKTGGRSKLRSEPRDDRSLKVAGILPGMTLHVIPIAHP